LGIISLSMTTMRSRKRQFCPSVPPIRSCATPLISTSEGPSINVQDRDGAFHLLRQARRLFPFIERIFADGGYAGQKMALVVWRTGAWKLQIVKRSDVAGFEVLPKRWIVERTFAWISRNRRLARDFERYATTVTAFIRLAMIRIMLRRLAANASS
jgi:transposase